MQIKEMSSSLQIFEDESHASVHSDKTKEGLSLFGSWLLYSLSFVVELLFSQATLNYTKTSLGRSLLRTWLLRPSLSLTVISTRHDAVECFLRTENIGSANAMHGHLKGIKNVPKILAILKSGKGKLSDWQGVVRV
jgi:DNA mismatch repair protein MSH5